MIDLALIRDSGAIEALKQQKSGRIHTLKNSLDELRNTVGEYPHFDNLIGQLQDLKVIQDEIMRIIKQVEDSRQTRWHEPN